MDIGSVKRDVKTVEEGKWITDIPGCEGLRLLVRGMSNKKYKAAISRIVRASPRKDKDQFGVLRTDVMQQAIGRALAEAVLLDWDGLTQGGETLPFDKKLALTLLTEPEYEPFQDAVVQAATMVDNMLGEVAEDAVKNSPPPSAPGSAETPAPPT